MKMTLNFSQFLDNWPESRKDQFSYDALKAIFEYYEQYTEDTGDDIEFDPIAICCEWTEYASELEAIEDYNYEPQGENDEEKGEDARKWLEDRTTVLETEKGIVLIQF